MPTTHEFETLLYTAEPPVGTITLNRPEHLNTIVPPMPDEIENAIGIAERDPNIKVIVLRVDQSDCSCSTTCKVACFGPRRI